jgi:Hint domain
MFGAFAATNTLGAVEALARRRRRRSGYSGGGAGSGHCYLKGTMIATPRGERAIDSLEIGDLVTTASGDSKPVKWIGRWKAEKLSDQSWEWAHVPVKIARGALDGALPHRELYVTDMHCLLVDGVLIPAIDLVNGVSIMKELPPTDELEYFHVELEGHDIVIANGAHSETLSVEAGDRQRFDNGDEYLQLYGSEPTCMTKCAPLYANNTRGKELLSRIRTTVAPICDVRLPHEIARARLAEEAMRRAV